MSKDKKPEDKKPDMSISEALNAMRAGGKQWRLWAKAEEAAAVIETELANADERHRAVAEANTKLAGLNVEIGKAETSLKAARESADKVVADAQARATVVMDNANGLLEGARKALESQKAAVEQAQAAQAKAEKARNSALAEEAAARERTEAAKAAARAALA